MKKFIQEFKDFISKGDVMNLAVGIIIGGAFQSIVKSLVEDIITPIISVVANANFDHLILKAGKLEIRWGEFVTEVINFFIMAIVIFMMIKFVSKINKVSEQLFEQDKKEQEITTKKCPYCMSEIDINATRCPHCTSQLSV